MVLYLEFMTAYSYQIPSWSLSIICMCNSLDQPYLKFTQGQLFVHGFICLQSSWNCHKQTQTQQTEEKNPSTQKWIRKRWCGTERKAYLINTKEGWQWVLYTIPGIFTGCDPCVMFTEEQGISSRGYSFISEEWDETAASNNCFSVKHRLTDGTGTKIQQ